MTLETNKTNNIQQDKVTLTSITLLLGISVIATVILFNPSQVFAETITITGLGSDFPVFRSNIAVSTTCPEDFFVKKSGTVQTRKTFISQESGGSFCEMSAIKYDISNIPQGATITKVSWNVTNTAGTGDKCDYRSIFVDPVLESNLFIIVDAIKNGITYIDATPTCSQPTNTIHDLGTQAVTDLQNQLDDENGFFAIGVISDKYPNRLLGDFLQVSQFKLDGNDLIIEFDPPPENQDPDCTAVTPSQDSLFPPNHKMNDITINGVTDPDGDTVTLMIDGITQDEPTNGTGDGDTSPDGDGVGTDTAQIRAERSGTDDGRVYEISFTADDGNGGMCTGMVSVSVPHDKKSTAVDSGQNFDSTQ